MQGRANRVHPAGSIFVRREILPSGTGPNADRSLSIRQLSTADKAFLVRSYCARFEVEVLRPRLTLLELPRQNLPQDSEVLFQPCSPLKKMAGQPLGRASFEPCAVLFWPVYSGMSWQ